jgi:hypothetical protein
MIDKALNLSNELTNTRHLLLNMGETYFGPDYYCQENKEFITLEYSDSYSYEKITLTPIIINEYGVIKYTIMVESYEMEDELELNNYFYCNEIRISESKLRQIEKKTDRTRDKYLKAPFNILKSHPEKMITVENTIFNRECFLNMTHYHYYYGKTITLETSDFNDIGPFLILRDFFKSIKMGDN